MYCKVPLKSISLERGTRAFHRLCSFIECAVGRGEGDDFLKRIKTGKGAEDLITDYGDEFGFPAVWLETYEVRSLPNECDRVCEVCKQEIVGELWYDGSAVWCSRKCMDEDKHIHDPSRAVRFPSPPPPRCSGSDAYFAWMKSLVRKEAMDRWAAPARGGAPYAVCIDFNYIQRVGDTDLVFRLSEGPDVKLVRQDEKWWLAYPDK